MSGTNLNDKTKPPLGLNRPCRNIAFHRIGVALLGQIVR
jgi:hypothetical protein